MHPMPRGNPELQLWPRGELRVDEPVSLQPSSCLCLTSGLILTSMSMAVEPIEHARNVLRFNVCLPKSHQEGQVEDPR
jgi:hypothetical protein